jgi:hypothetical protein
MIIGSHLLLSGQDRVADRGFFRDGLGVRSLAVGESWLIFSTPPAEGGIHPLDGEFSQRPAGHQRRGAVLYSLCDDLEAHSQFLNGRNVHCTGMQSAPWGRVATIPLPSGSHIGLYQPLHTTAFNLNSH